MNQPLITDPPERRILGLEHVDALGQAVLALTRELWIVTDRMTVLERLLEDMGLPAGAVDGYQPDEATEQLLAERRDRLMQVVTQAFG
ncbi:hypothetical protein [Novosphingobium sp. BL-52-GroH]|uniref:hypothetical protein n=1 Tax=Novosphingobium sp. BL-52-GroH TaxID=3349877 RepID=UPI00384D9374